MDQARRRVFGGSMQHLYDRELQAIEEQKLLNRLWAQDVGAWDSPESEKSRLKSNLQFLHLPDRLPELAAETLRTDAEAREHGLTQRLLIAFGSVHHFCKALLSIRPDSQDRPCLALSSCQPQAIRQVELEAKLLETLIVMINKSGYQLEDHALFLYFQKMLEAEVSGASARHFAAASGPSTFLTTMAKEYRFRAALELPPGISAAYCSLIYLAGLLVVFAGVDLEVLRIACRQMRRVYSDTSEGAENPAREMAAFLTATRRSERLFVTFLAGPALDPLAAAFCRLIGGSLGKGGHGLFPLASTIPSGTEATEAASSFVALRNGLAEEPQLEECLSGLRTRGTPFLEISVGDPLDLLRHTFGWQIATVLAGARLGIDPFEEAEVRLPRTLAAEMLNSYSPEKDTLQRRARIQENGIQLFAEARTRQEISQLNLVECLISFFANRHKSEYLGLFVFVGESEEAQAEFLVLREQLAQALRLPVLLAWGPRSLDTFGYLLREGAPPGLMWMITDDPALDVAIPGANYSFGQLYHALALGQFEAWEGLALRLHLMAKGPEGLATLRNSVHQALRRLHT